MLPKPAILGETLYGGHGESRVRLNSVMSEPQLAFLQYSGQTPWLAGCARCHLKFLTLGQLMAQPQAAADYLREKFARHTCKWEIVEQARVGTRPRRLRIMKQTQSALALGICEECSRQFRAS